MASARARLDVNYMDALSVQKEPYELQREAMISQGAQTVDAAQESERGTAAAAGRVQMAQADVQGGIRTAMGKELTEIERLKVAEEARLRDLNVQLDLGEVEGKQMEARNNAEMAAQATAQGLEGVTSMATQAANLIPLYPNLGGKEAVAGTLKILREFFLILHQYHKHIKLLIGCLGLIFHAKIKVFFQMQAHRHKHNNQTICLGLILFLNKKIIYGNSL